MTPTEMILAANVQKLAVIVEIVCQGLELPGSYRKAQQVADKMGGMVNTQLTGQTEVAGSPI